MSRRVVAGARALQRELDLERLARLVAPARDASSRARAVNDALVAQLAADPRNVVFVVSGIWCWECIRLGSLEGLSDSFFDVSGILQKTVDRYLDPD